MSGKEVGLFYITGSVSPIPLGHHPLPYEEQSLYIKVVKTVAWVFSVINLAWRHVTLNTPVCRDLPPICVANTI